MAMFLLLLTSSVLSQCYTKTVHFYVDPYGSDTNDGLHLRSPVKSLAKAVSLATRSKYSQNDLYIELLPGYHHLDQTLNINHYYGNKLTIRSYQGQEVHVTGGKRIPSTSFHRVADQDILNALHPSARSHVRKVFICQPGARFTKQVRYVDLKALNITDYGGLGTYGFYKTRSAPLEIFHNGHPLRLARWPNQGFINIVGLPDGENGHRFRYNSTRPQTWKHIDDPWVYGFWFWSWADRSAKVSQLNTKTMTVTLANNSDLLYGLKLGNWGRNPLAGFSSQGGYFRFINILSELDESGEYYLDRQTGRLYAWFPTPSGSVKSSDIIYVSMIKTCIRLNGKNHNVVFSGFTLEGCRERGILGYNVKNIQIHNMEIRNTGDFGAYLSGDSRNCYISKSIFHDCDGGITIGGGNRKLLESSGNIVEDCEFYRFSREGAVGMNAISTDGVGSVLRYNKMYIGQYTAIRYSGNDHVIEYNHIYNTCMNASDCGAIHTGRDWTYRGNKIRYNIVHHTLRLVPGADVRGVMLDDQASSAEITDNVFYDNEVHVNIGGGRDNIISNNIMYNATKSTMQVDGRGLTRKDYDTYIDNKLHEMPYRGSLWSLRYPKLAAIDSMNKTLPEGNQIHTNLVYNEAGIQYINGYSGLMMNPKYFNVTNNGASFGPSDHFDAPNGDLRIKCHALEWANYVSFRQVLTVNDVGPRYDVGPPFNKIVKKTKPLSGSNGICTTNAPAKTTPMPAYIPDGSGQTPLINVTNQGCWFRISGCSKDPGAVGTYRDKYGEKNAFALHNETMCFKRAVAQWHYCGSNHGEEVMAVYGPTGATTIVGDGCFTAQYGCPRHGGPADGHVTTGKVFRDTWAEQHQNAANDEAKCLNRAVGQWRYCGSFPNHPVTSIYRPTGAKRTAGSGCWLRVAVCPKHPVTHQLFYDSFGASNLNSDDAVGACFARAEDYWIHCGADVRYPVTAFYRPTAESTTYPNQN